MKVERKILILTSSYPRFKSDSICLFLREFFLLLNNKYNALIVAPSHNEFLNISSLLPEESKISRFRYFWPLKWQRLAYGDGIPDNIKKSYLAVIQIPFFFIAFFFTVLRSVSKYDIIHAHWAVPAGLVGRIIKFFFNLPLIITIHSSDFYYLNKTLLGKKLFFWIISGADIITVISDNLKKEIKKNLKLKEFLFIKNKLRVIPMGITKPQKISDWEILKYKEEKKIKKSDKIILYIGRLVPIKGVIYLLKAAQNIKDIILLIAGEGSDKKMLFEYAQKHDLNCKFIGQVVGYEKQILLAAADIGVLPSISIDGRKEGLPVTLIEVMASDLPVIVTDTGYADGLIINGKNGFIVPQKNYRAIKDKLLLLLNNKTLRSEQSKLNHEKVKKFYWSEVIKKYEKLYTRYFEDARKN